MTNPTIPVYEPPVVPKNAKSRFWDYGGEPLDWGVRGTAFEEGGLILIPFILAEVEGSGNVGRFLDRLSSRCRIICVTCKRLEWMLRRRGWVRYYHPEYRDIWKKEFATS